jgi:hypothetical protein
VPEVLVPSQTRWWRLSNVDEAMMKSDRLVDDETTIRIEFFQHIMIFLDVNHARLYLGFIAHQAFQAPSTNHQDKRRAYMNLLDTKI